MDAKALFVINNNIIQNQLVQICSDLTDEQVRFGHEAVDERGIGNVVTHLYWSVVNRSRALAGLAREQAPDPPQTTADLLAFIDRAHDQAEGLITQIPEDQLEAVITLPYGEFQGAIAMLDGFAHAFRHIGNVLDARHLGGFETHALG
jgi:hypothetical protein